MPGDEASSSSDADKIFGITNIKSFISVTLNMEEHNYALWKLMFEMHCVTWEVDGFLDGTAVSKGTEDKAWKKRDNLIKMWIYNTIAPSLLQMVMKKGDTAHQLWKALEDLFQSNKDARAMQLNEDLRNTRLGDLTIEAYCHKMKVLYDLLENIGEPIPERTLVMHTINGLSEKFGNIATFIRHQKPLPSFLDTRAMLELEETRFKSLGESTAIKDTSSSPTVLHIRDNVLGRNTAQQVPQVCRNFYRGNCSYGERCRYLHVTNNGGQKKHNGGGRNPTPKLGNNSNRNSPIVGSNPVVYYCYPPPQGHGPTASQGYGPTAPMLHSSPPPGFGPSPNLVTHFNPGATPVSGSGGFSDPGQAMHVQQSDQPTTLPQAFANMSFKDNSEWYMDTGATSHLTSDTGNLRTVFNKRNIPSILVGDGSSIPVTNTGHSFFANPNRPIKPK